MIGGETMDEIVQLINTIGFPIAIAVYLLVFQDKKLSALQAAIENNTKVLTKLITKLGDDDDGE